MFSWIFKQGIKREIKKEIEHVHNILHNSFGNIKQDITDLNNKHSNLHDFHLEKEKKLDEYENRIIRLENYILNQLEKPLLRVKKEKFEEPINEFFKTLTHTHQKIFVTLYQLQESLEGHPISIKSLSKIIYPDKKYSAIISTLSEYISFLETSGLISKVRRGREMLIEITDQGLEYIEKLKEEGKIEKKKLKIKR